MVTVKRSVVLYFLEFLDSALLFLDVRSLFLVRTNLVSYVQNSVFFSFFKKGPSERLLGACDFFSLHQAAFTAAELFAGPLINTSYPECRLLFHSWTLCCFSWQLAYSAPALVSTHQRNIVLYGCSHCLTPEKTHSLF